MHDVYLVTVVFHALSALTLMVVVTVSALLPMHRPAVREIVLAAPALRDADVMQLLTTRDSRKAPAPPEATEAQAA